MEITKKYGLSLARLFLAGCALALWGAVVWHAAVLFPQTVLFNSDAATEVLYARHMAQTGALLPDSWYFTTEMRLWHNSLVMAPLFLFISDMALVHTLAVAITAALLYGAGFFFLRGLGAGPTVSLLGALLLLAPVSILSFEYYQSALYYSFFLLALLLIWAFMARALRRPMPARRRWVWLLLCGALALVMGMCGIRYLEIFFLPLGGVAVLGLLQGGLFKPGSWRRQSLYLALCALGLASYLATALAQRAGLLPQGALSALAFTQPGQLLQKFKETLAAYGVAGHSVGPGGALLRLAILAGGLRLCLRYKALCRPCRDYLLFALLANAVNILVLTAVDFGNMVQYRYALLPYTLLWFLPPLAIADLLRADGPAWTRRAAGGLAAAVVLCGAFGAYYNVLHMVTQPQVAADRAAVVRYLEAEGYTFGYADYWNANVLTYLSNGAVEAASVGVDPATGGLSPFPLGCPKDYFQPVPGREKKFLLLGPEQRAAAALYGAPLYENQTFSVYEAPSVPLLP